MSHAVIVSESSVQLHGTTPAPTETQRTVEQMVAGRIDLAALPRKAHVGYSKVREDGEVIVSLFPEFEHDQP